MVLDADTYIPIDLKVGHQRKLIELAMRHKDRLKGKNKAERELAEQQLRDELKSDPEIVGMFDPMTILMAINVILTIIKLWKDRKPKGFRARRGRIELIPE